VTITGNMVTAFVVVALLVLFFALARSMLRIKRIQDSEYLPAADDYNRAQADFAAAVDEAGRLEAMARAVAALARMNAALKHMGEVSIFSIFG